MITDKNNLTWCVICQEAIQDHSLIDNNQQYWKYCEQYESYNAKTIFLSQEKASEEISFDIFGLNRMNEAKLCLVRNWQSQKTR